MWRTHTIRKGRKILSLAQRQFAAEAGGAGATPPPQQPKSRSFGLVKFLGLGLPLATGGLVGYAWYDKDFRKRLEDTVPYAKELLDNVLPPLEAPTTPRHASKEVSKLPAPSNQSFPPPLIDPPQSSPAFPASLVPSAFCSSETESVSETMDKIEKCDRDKDRERFKGESERNVNNNRSDLMEGDRGVEGGGDKASDEAAQKEPTASGKSQGLATAQQKKEEAAKAEKLSIQDQVRMQEEEEKADNAALEVVVEKLLESGHNWVSEAAKAQLHVAKATRNHSNLLKKAMDDSSDVLHKDAEWEDVTIAFKEREIAVARANELVEEAKKSMEKLKKVLNEAKANKVLKKNAAIIPASKKLSEFNKELSAAGAQVRQADADAKVMLKYKDLVDKGRRQFQMELESLMPDIKPGGSKGGKLSEEELNTLIAHAHRRIEQLQKQLAEQLAMERQRLSAALDVQQEENTSVTQGAVNDERLRLLSEFEIEKQKLELEFVSRMESGVRKSLSRQAAAHSDHLKDVLAVQEQELSKDFERKLNMKLLEEREKFQSETSSWISRLKGIEAAVDARAASEQLARRAQDLWLACIALNSTILFGNEEGEADTLLPLKPHIEAVVNSANKHPFVETIAKSIPDTALNRGVYTESELRDRFDRVSTVSWRLGLIQESGASLYKYFVSFLHSIFTVRNVAAYSEKDLVAVDEMDNFELLANAQYWMERGNLEMALRFMSQLKGESRTAAEDWIAEVWLLLETRQAAHTITAFASASGLAAQF